MSFFLSMLVYFVLLFLFFVAFAFLVCAEHIVYNRKHSRIEITGLTRD